MNKLEKLLERVRNNPKNVTFEELRTLLESKAFELNRVKGSHYFFPSEDRSISIPYKKPHVKAIYVKRVLELID